MHTNIFNRHDIIRRKVVIFFYCKNNILLSFLQTIVFDGGEFRSLAGEFNKLRVVTPEMWDGLEKMIRSTNKKQKGEEKSKL